MAGNDESFGGVQLTHPIAAGELEGFTVEAMKSFRSSSFALTSETCSISR